LFTPTELRKLEQGKTLRSGNGFCARSNATGSISFLVMRKVKGNPVPKSYKVGQAFKDDPNLNKAILNAQAKATQYATLMSEGIDPREEEKLVAEDLVKKQRTLGELLTIYEHSRHSFKVGNAHGTMLDRRNTLENVYGDWFNKPINSITKEGLLNRYYEWSSGQNPKTSQAKKSVRYLRSLFNHAINILDLLDKNPCDVFKGQISMKSNTDKSQYLLPSETINMLRNINALINTYGKDTEGLLEELKLDVRAISKYELQTYNAIKLMLYSGLRLNEVLQLRWKDIHIDGTELNPNPFFQVVIENRKQKTPFGVPIIKEMKEVFSHQKMIQSVLEVGAIEDDKYLTNINVKYKKLFRHSEFVFPSNKSNSNMKKVNIGFGYLNQLMPDLISASKIGANQLRHTFATLAHSVGYPMSEIHSMTGHGIVGSSNLATEVYVGVIADDNRSRFERVAKAINGTMIKDNEVREIIDNVGQQIANDPKVLEDKLAKGLLTEKEKVKYNADAIAFEKSIIVEEKKLQDLINDNPQLPSEVLKARHIHIRHMKNHLKKIKE
jgi:integrase